MRTVPIVFATNEEYAKYLSVAISSIISCADEHNYYELFVFFSDMSVATQNRLEQMSCNNVKIEFIDVTDKLELLGNLSPTNCQNANMPCAHISPETYYHLLIPELLIEYEQVLYLDCDIVVCKDPALLFNQNIGAAIYGVRNVSSLSTKRYVETKLGIDCSFYINAGVLLVDTARARQFQLLERCKEIVDRISEFVMVDQDMLNIVLSQVPDALMLIDAHWNVPWHPIGKSMLNICSACRADYCNALSDPYIIHYTSSEKPWRYPDRVLADKFYKFAQLSPFYDEIMREPKIHGAKLLIKSKLTFTPVVSVIMPVYNEERYIANTIASVLNQTLSEIELICIDDGSSDASYEIISGFAEKDARITVIKQPNSGAGIARNVGISHATGKYLFFLDSDDYIYDTALEKLSLFASENKTDIVFFNAVTENVETGEIRCPKAYLDDTIASSCTGVFSAADIATQMFRLSGACVWNKLYRAGFVHDNGMLFQQLDGADDVFFSMLAATHAERCAILNERLVCHTIGDRNSQMMRTELYPYNQTLAWCSVKMSLMDDGIFDRFEVGFVSRVAKNFFRNMSYIESYEPFCNFMLKMRSEGFRGLGISSLDQSFWSEKFIAERMSMVLHTQSNIKLYALRKWFGNIRHGINRANETAHEPKVSIIIPVFNAAQYLNDCLECIACQSLNDIEVICVDDGSTDSSPEILAHFANDIIPNMHVIRTENRGGGAARNTGMSIARGEYLAFVDADDIFDSDMIQKAYDKACSVSADVVVFDAYRFCNKTENISVSSMMLNKRHIPDFDVFSAKDIPDTILNISLGMTWNKLFKREFIECNSLRFQEIQNSNTVFFVFAALALAQKITALDEKIMFYRTNNPSSVVGAVSNNAYCFVDAWRAIRCRLTEKGLFDTLRRSYINAFALYAMQRLREIHVKDVYVELYNTLSLQLFPEFDVFPHEKSFFHLPSVFEWCREIHSMSAETYIEQHNIAFSTK